MFIICGYDNKSFVKTYNEIVLVHLVVRVSNEMKFSTVNGRESHKWNIQRVYL